MAPRQKKFSKQEDIKICEAWRCISEDPIVGAGQTKEGFWERIYEEFLSRSNEKDEHRSFDSVQSRWQRFFPDMTKFSSLVNREYRANRSGFTDDDKWSSAHSQYLGVWGESFKFEHCYRKLHNTPKWDEWMNSRSQNLTSQKRQKTNSGTEFTGGSSNDTPTSQVGNINLEDDADVDADVEIVTPNRPSPGGAFLNPGDGQARRPRPPGRKASKEKARMSSSSSTEVSGLPDYSAHFEKVSNTAAEELALKKASLDYKARILEQMEMDRQQRYAKEKRKEDERRRKEEREIMSMDLGTINDPIRKKYWEDQQKEIFQRRHREINNFSPIWSGSQGGSQSSRPTTFEAFSGQEDTQDGMPTYRGCPPFGPLDFGPTGGPFGK